MPFSSNHNNVKTDDLMYLRCAHQRETPSSSAYIADRFNLLLTTDLLIDNYYLVWCDKMVIEMSLGVSIVLLMMTSCSGRYPRYGCIRYNDHELFPVISAK